MNLFQADIKRAGEAFWKPKSWFLKFGDGYECGPHKDLLIHQDNGKRILVVAHMDSVQAHFQEPKKNSQGKRNRRLAVESAAEIQARWAKQYHTGPVVDDRLGCAMALGCMGFADLLFTDAEEVGQSTAAYFDPPREYNWIVGFDRRGTGVVTYKYNDKVWQDALKETFTIEHGSVSDISYLTKHKTSAFNLGIGYYNEHTARATWNIKDNELQTARFLAFLRKHGDTRFPHDPSAKPIYTYPYVAADPKGFASWNKGVKGYWKMGKFTPDESAPVKETTGQQAGVKGVWRGTEFTPNVSPEKRDPIPDPTQHIGKKDEPKRHHKMPMSDPAAKWDNGRRRYVNKHNGSIWNYDTEGWRDTDSTATGAI